MFVQYRSRGEHSRPGFSFLEMLAIVTIIGAIAVVVIPRISASRENAMHAVALHGEREIRTAMERHYFETNAYPTDANAFMHDGEYCDPGLLTQDYQDFMDAGYWYTYNTTSHVFSVTLNGVPIE